MLSRLEGDAGPKPNPESYVVKVPCENQCFSASCAIRGPITALKSLNPKP